MNMDKQLYRVNVVLYVLAENEAEARLAATQARFHILETTAQKVDAFDLEWNDALSYFADNERPSS
jgi:hypothetical protein